MEYKTCPLLAICGGCKYDFFAPDYRDEKIKLIDKWNLTEAVLWAPVGSRRRADLCFADGKLGFYEYGTKNIVPIENCPNLIPEINAVLPRLSALPWVGAGSALVTLCDNGLDLTVSSNVPFFTTEFKNASEKLGFLRVSWNGKIICQTKTPMIRFGDSVIEYPTGAFLQPTVPSETAMREFVVQNTAGARRVADLFCGIGNFTFALKADGFDIAGIGIKRDLLKNPLSAKMLNQYDAVVLDPPRAGAMTQCQELAKSDIKRIVYISCNPTTLQRDLRILTDGGYKVTKLAAFDQFVGTEHWELGAVLQK